MGCTSGAQLTTRHDNTGKSRPAAPSRTPLPSRSASGVSRPARMTSKPTEGAEKRFFGYKFKDPSLLTLALTHSSLAYESSPERTHEPGSDNEQLEFIGDAVLGLVVAEALYRRFPTSREGTLT